MGDKMRLKRGTLTEIATDMISRQLTEGVVKKRLGKGLWVSWTGERLSLSRKDAWPSDTELEIVVKAFGLSGHTLRYERLNYADLYVIRAWLPTTPPSVEVAQSGLGLDILTKPLEYYNV